MLKRLLILALLALLCLGCAAKDPEEQGKRLGTGAGAVAGAGVLTAVGNPCAGVAVLVQGALEATGVNDALHDLGRSDTDPKFVAFMEQLQRETEERRAARGLGRKVAPGEGDCSLPPKAGPMPRAGTSTTPTVPFGARDSSGGSADTTEQTVAENAG